MIETPYRPHSMIIDEKISLRYSQLSDKLKLAADFIIANPLDVASRSLRSIATTTGLSPATYSRLAKALGYQNYEELREESRRSVSDRMESFSERAVRVRTEGRQHPGADFLALQAQPCRTNMEAFFREIDQTHLKSAAQSLVNARRVSLVGSLGSHAMLSYFAYMAGWFSDNWSVAGQNGVSLANMLANTRKDDVVVILSLVPFAKRSIAAYRIATERQAKVIVITDSHTFPDLGLADNHFLVRTDSSNFFSSYAAVTVLLETMVSMMVSLSGEEADLAISKVEKENQRLEEI